MIRIRRPRRTWIRLLAVILMLSCAAALMPVFSEAGAEDRLTIGVPTDRCPVFYLDGETGEIEGIGADLMRIAATAAGYTITFRPIGEATLMDALDNKEYDLVMPFGSAITSTSGQQIIVSDNLIQTPFTLVTEGSHEVAPMNKLKVGMLSSLAGAAETVRELYPGMGIILFDTMADSVSALREGLVDALLHNSFVWSYVLQKPSYSDLAVQPSAMFSMDFRAGAPDTPEGRAIIGRLDAGIARITEPQRQAVVLDYTTRRLYRYDFSDYLHLYGLVVLLGILLLIAVVVIVLQKQYTIRLKQEEELRRLVDYDPLTGALSLRGFRKRVEELLRAHPDTPYILSYANIRNFKYINDSLGMDAGDELLRFWVEKSLENMTGEEAICRISADHIAALVRADKDEEIVRGDQKVIDSVRNYFIDRGKENRVQICGGVYILTPEDYRVINVDHMLDYARVTEKKIRETRKDGYGLYNPEQWEKGKRIAEVINHLPMAIRSGDIHVWYQPQVNGKTGAIFGAEALCRWDHEMLGWLQPNDFIETLEESGLIFDLDCYVWNKACQDLQRWNREGKRRSISVNVSRCDIREDRDIPAIFRGLVQRYELTPDQIRIEITETAFVENPADLIRTTEKLREYGFEVEMDDFGSGHSSLHMLKEVPVDRIKLDLHFLTDSGDPVKGRVIVSHMIRMVNELGMKMIAEGVETAEQAEFLQSRGCSDMQGFYYYKPMPVEDFEKVVNNQLFAQA